MVSFIQLLQDPPPHSPRKPPFLNRKLSPIDNHLQIKKKIAFIQWSLTGNANCSEGQTTSPAVVD